MKTETDSLAGRALWVYLVAAFLDLLGMAVTAPLMPFVGPELNLPFHWYGAVLAVYPAGFMVSSLVTGCLIKRVGFRRLSIAMSCGSCLGFALAGMSGFVSSWPLYLLGRGLGGLFAGSPTIAQGFICTFPEASHRQLFLRYGTVLSLSMLSGQMVLLLAEFGYFAPIWLCCGLNGLLSITCYCVATDRYQKTVSSAATTAQRPQKMALIAVLMVDVFAIADLACFFTTALPVIYVELYLLQPYQVSMLVLGQASVGIVTRETVVRWASRRFEGSEGRLALVAFVACVLVHFPFFLMGPGSFWLRMLPSVCFYAILYNIAFPLCQASVQVSLALFAGSEKALIMGIREIALGLSRVVFVPLGTILLTFPYPFGPLLLSSCCAVVATLLWTWVLLSNKTRSPAAKTSVRV